jgi:uncharacterized zinc-type alcohol dehydrogenase-like protein
VNNGWGASTFPMVPGHEIAGIVSQVGTKVTRYKEGDRAAVGNFVDSCRKCRPCRQGLEQYCVEGATWTYNSFERDDGKTPTQGGYSNKIVVDENYVLGFLRIFLWIERRRFSAPVSHSIHLLCIGELVLERK